MPANDLCLWRLWLLRPRSASRAGTKLGKLNLITTVTSSWHKHSCWMPFSLSSSSGWPFPDGESSEKLSYFPQRQLNRMSMRAAEVDLSRKKIGTKHKDFLSIRLDDIIFRTRPDGHFRMASMRTADVDVSRWKMGAKRKGFLSIRIDDIIFRTRPDGHFRMVFMRTAKVDLSK